MSAKSATERSRARYRRAAYTLPPVTLDARLAAKLRAIMDDRKVSAAAFVRESIRTAVL